MRPSLPGPLELRQLSAALASAATHALPTRPDSGWLKVLRNALGMTAAQLATRLGISQPSVIRAEQREAAGSITLDSLQKMANAMDAELVYFLAPRTSLMDTVRKRAELTARADAAAAAAALGIEWQVVPPLALAQQIETEAERLLAERPSRIWDRQNGE